MVAPGVPPDAVSAARVRRLVPDQESKAKQVLAVNLVVRPAADRPHRGTADHPVSRIRPKAGAVLEDGDEHGGLLRGGAPRTGGAGEVRHGRLLWE